MKKTEFLLQIITPISLVISAVWYAAMLDKEISLAQQSIASMKVEIRSFEYQQERLNEKQDRQLEAYRGYYDEKMNLILNKL